MSGGLRNLILDSHESGDHSRPAGSKKYAPMDIQMQIELEIMRLMLMHAEAGLVARRRGAKRMPTIMLGRMGADDLPAPSRTQIYADDIDDYIPDPGNVDLTERKIQARIRARLRKGLTGVTGRGIRNMAQFQRCVDGEIARRLHMHNLVGLEVQRRRIPRMLTLAATYAYHVVDGPRPEIPCRAA